jgi:hypothetical protein
MKYEGRHKNFMHLDLIIEVKTFTGCMFCSESDYVAKMILCKRHLLMIVFFSARLYVQQK